MKIIVLGSIAYDRIMDFPGYFKDHILPDKVHKLSVSFLINDIKENFGGNAGNIAYSLGLIKEQAAPMGTVGKDFTRYRKWFLKNKIEMKHVKVVKNDLTPSAHIITDRDNNQITGFHVGSMKFPSKFSETSLRPYRGKAMAIVAPTHKDDMIKMCTICRKLGIPYIFDPGQQLPSLSGPEMKRCIKGAKVFIVNDYEMEMTLKKTGLSEKSILKMAEILVVTLGAKGSVVKTGNKVHRIPSVKPKKLVDPTGAGDAYRAGFVKGLIHDLPLPICGRLGSVTAIYPVEHYGTQEHAYNWKEFVGRYQKNFGKLVV